MPRLSPGERGTLDAGATATAIDSVSSRRIAAVRGSAPEASAAPDPSSTASVGTVSANAARTDSHPPTPVAS